MTKDKKNLNDTGMIKAIAWDFDGTIVDNHHIFLSAINESIQHASHVFSLNPVGEGRSLGEFYEALPHTVKQDISLESWSEKVRKICIERLDSSHIRPGVKNLMEECRIRGIPQVCVSNSEKESLLLRMEKLKIRDFFYEIIGVDEVQAPKPSPIPYELACEKLGLSPHKVLAIEDSPSGLKSAVEAGLRTVAYPLNSNNTAHFKEACFIFQDISKVKELL